MNSSLFLFLFHKHSLRYLAYAFAFTLLFAFLDLELFALVAFAFMLFAAYAFRNPPKIVQNFETDALLSPVDGKVVSVEEIEDAAFGYKIVIESSYKDLSILRAPMKAGVSDLTLVRGTRVAKSSKLFSDLNEYGVISFTDESGRSVKVEHRLTRSFAPLIFDANKYETLEKGASYGVMLSGVTTLYLPKSFKLNVNAATQVSAAETLLGYFL